MKLSGLRAELRRSQQPVFQRGVALGHVVVFHHLLDDFLPAYAETTTTVLMYMCGTDLQSACVEDMYEMCTGNYSDQITVAVQAGGATEWDGMVPFSGWQVKSCISGKTALAAAILTVVPVRTPSLSVPSFLTA